AAVAPRLATGRGLSGRAARFVVFDTARAQFGLFVIVAALAAIGAHVDPARSLHLAHMVDQILGIVAFVARLRFPAVFERASAARGLGDGLSLRLLVLLLAVPRLGRFVFLLT